MDDVVQHLETQNANPETAALKKDGVALRMCIVSWRMGVNSFARHSRRARTDGAGLKSEIQRASLGTVARRKDGAAPRMRTVAWKMGASSFVLAGQHLRLS